MNGAASSHGGDGASPNLNIADDNSSVGGKDEDDDEDDDEAAEGTDPEKLKAFNVSRESMSRQCVR